MKQKLLLFCLSVVAWNSTADAGKSPQRTPTAGYECKIEERGDFGLIKADFLVLDSGQLQNDYVNWDAGDGVFRNPWITAVFFRQKTGGFSLSNGYVSIMRHIWDKAPGQRPRALKLSLELTTNPIRMFASSRMAGALERSGGPFHLQLDWSDAAALAKGSSSLYLVARDGRHDVVDQVEIDKGVFSRAEPHIMSTFQQAEQMMANPRKLCAHSDDLRTDDIVVT